MVLELIDKKGLAYLEGLELALALRLALLLALAVTKLKLVPVSELELMFGLPRERRTVASIRAIGYRRLVLTL